MKGHKNTNLTNVRLPLFPLLSIFCAKDILGKAYRSNVKRIKMLCLMSSYIVFCFFSFFPFSFRYFSLCQKKTQWQFSTLSTNFVNHFVLIFFVKNPRMPRSTKLVMKLCSPVTALLFLHEKKTTFFSAFDFKPHANLSLIYTCLDFVFDAKESYVMKDELQQLWNKNVGNAKPYFS